MKLDEEVARFSYRPGWKFELLELGGYGAVNGKVLRISATLEDSRNPGQMIPLVFQFAAPHVFVPGDEEIIPHWIQSCLYQIAEHEVDEWLKYDGKLLRDPHAKK